MFHWELLHTLWPNEFDVDSSHIQSVPLPELYQVWSWHGCEFLQCPWCPASPCTLSAYFLDSPLKHAGLWFLLGAGALQDHPSLSWLFCVTFLSLLNDNQCPCLRWSLVLDLSDARTAQLAPGGSHLLGRVAGDSFEESHMNSRRRQCVEAGARLFAPWIGHGTWSSFCDRVEAGQLGDSSTWASTTMFASCTETKTH